MIAKKNINKRSIIKYFNGIIQKGFILSGQQCGDGDDIDLVYQNVVEPLKKNTNKKPAIIGADYGWKETNNLNKVNFYLKKHWNEGGLVTISWHLGNPFKEGYLCRINSVEYKDKIDLNKIVKSALSSQEKDSYRMGIDKIAKALTDLKNDGVVVLWRPFHEMNGDWFWWGINAYGGKQTNEKDFINLWIDLYNTLTIDYQLDNLIWVYSPNQSYRWSAPVCAYYPGDNYVDIVGADIYSTQPSFNDYDNLKALKKITVATELGPTSSSYGLYDQMKVVEVFRYKAAYFLQWHSWKGAKVAIVDNLNYHKMMDSPYIINLEDFRSKKVKYRE